MKRLLIILCLLSSCRENLVAYNSESEANKVLLELKEQNIDVKKINDANTWLLKVKSEDYLKSLSILEKKRLYVEPITKEPSSGSLFATRNDKNTANIDKISKELSLSIGLFPGVVESRVHIFKDDQSSLSYTKSEESASVIVISDRGVLLDKEQIKLLVAKGAGIPADSVVVVQQEVEATFDDKAEKEALNPTIHSVSFINLDLFKYVACVIITVVMFLFIFKKSIGKRKSNLDDLTTIKNVLDKVEHEHS